MGWHSPSYYGSDKPEYPTEWQHRLEEVFPRTRTASWLLIRWEPGNPWEPVNRWLVWHMQPLSVLANRQDTLAELNGPNPRSTGHYCASGHCLCSMKANAWKDGAAFTIDKQQWDIYREHKLYATRWWTAQGNSGGHRHRLTNTEKQINKLMSGAYDTPKPGALPYSPFDNRAFEKVVRFGEWKQLERLAKFVQQHPDKVGQFEEEVRKLFGELMWNWVGEKAYGVKQDLTRQDRLDLAASAPVGLDRETRMRLSNDAHFERVEQSYLTGTF